MKKLYLFLVLLNLAILMSCQKNPLDSLSNDKVPPGKVEIVSVTPIHGGFEVEFKQPSDNDLLYIKAEYDLIGGTKGEVEVSYFDNKLQVVGFGDTAERTAKIYAVDRSGNMSVPVEIKATPLVPPIKLIQDSLAIIADFGGARFSWINRTKAPISIEIFGEDSVTHKLTRVNTIYTSQLSSKYSVRNMKPIPAYFAAVVRDRWDNVSDTIWPLGRKLTPLYEKRLDKTKIKMVYLASDTRFNLYGGIPENLFDDNFNSWAHSQGDHPFPNILTFDLGVKANLSRIRFYQRTDYPPARYSGGNWKRYDVYGVAVLPANPDDLSKWQKLREVCIASKPSGWETWIISDEDNQHMLNGDEYDIDQVENPSEIRYFRVVIWETMGGTGYAHASEITWWGNYSSL